MCYICHKGPGLCTGILHTIGQTRRTLQVSQRSCCCLMQHIRTHRYMLLSFFTCIKQASVQALIIRCLVAGSHAASWAKAITCIIIHCGLVAVAGCGLPRTEAVTNTTGVGARMHLAARCGCALRWRYETMMPGVGSAPCAVATDHNCQQLVIAVLAQHCYHGGIL
jgi:hypothetical protein